MINKILDEIEKHHKFYYTIAYRYLKNHEDAQDVLQNAYTRMVTKYPKSLTVKKLRSWMAVICCNEAKTMLSIKERRSLSDSILSEISNGTSNYGIPHDLEFYYEDIAYASIKLVPQEYQEALFEYYKYSTPILSLAKKYHVPESNLRYWRKKVEKHLKEFL